VITGTVADSCDEEENRCWGGNILIANWFPAGAPAIEGIDLPAVVNQRRTAHRTGGGWGFLMIIGGGLIGLSLHNLS
jgi:hypothetical protein